MASGQVNFCHGRFAEAATTLAPQGESHAPKHHGGSLMEMRHTAQAAGTDHGMASQQPQRLDGDMVLLQCC